MSFGGRPERLDDFLSQLFAGSTTWLDRADRDCGCFSVGRNTT